MSNDSTNPTVCTWGTDCPEPAVAEVFEGATDDLTSGAPWRAMCRRHVHRAAQCASVDLLKTLPMWTFSIRHLTLGRHHKVPA